MLQSNMEDTPVKQMTRRTEILKEMAGIRRMEKGSLRPEYREVERDGERITLGPYYKHQRWENGKNVSRRVSADEADSLAEAVDGYHRYQELAEEFAELTITMTHEADQQGKKKPT